MTELNTKTIINYLPFDPKVKLELLEAYDSIPLEEQIRISRLVWQAFSEFENIKIKGNFDKGLKEASKANQKLDENYYKKIIEETQKDTEAKLSSAQESVDITRARKSMEQIVREINASKKQTAP
jgi:hypothetical protein